MTSRLKKAECCCRAGSCEWRRLASTDSPCGCGCVQFTCKVEWLTRRVMGSSNGALVYRNEVAQ